MSIDVFWEAAERWLLVDWHDRSAFIYHSNVYQLTHSHKHTDKIVKKVTTAFFEKKNWVCC